MANIPPPPVPPRLRQMLEDYPELIQKVQEELNWIVNEMVGRFNATPPFERAVWRLEDSFGDLMVRADAEAEAAKTRGDQQAAERAEKRAHLMGCIGSDRPWYDRSEQGLWNYFRTYKEAFE